jgi:FolB domain-containing protein
MPNSIHSATHAPWQAIISQIETQMCIGICDHETIPQRLWVDAEIHGYYPAYPTDISQCIDYGMLHNLVTKEWPTRPQTLLLETLVMELFEFIFAQVGSASHVTIGIYKPDVFKEAQKVGVRLSLTRAEFLQLKASKP